VAPVVFRALGADKPVDVAVVIEASDVAGDPIATLSAALNGAAATAGAPAHFQLSRVDDPAAAAAAVRDGTRDGLLTIDRAAAGDLAFTYLTDASPRSPATMAVRQAASALTIDDRLGRAGIDPSDRGAIFAPPAFTATSTDPNEEDRQGTDFAARASLGTVLVVLILIAIVNYGNWIASSVAEEKSNRVMELLVTAATPRQLLVGKVIGTAAAAMTQYAALLAAGIAGLLLQGEIGRRFFGDAATAAPGAGLDAWLLIVFGACFVGGFLVYAGLYAAAGSLISRSEEVQQVAGPIIVIAMVGYFSAILGGTTAPDATWLKILTFVPFWSPYLVPLRMAYGTISPGEIVGALALLAVGVVVILWLASRVYAAGVLLYGQRPGLRTIWRAARAAR
jgi:ABC-2 type transport system permease protein